MLTPHMVRTLKMHNCGIQIYIDALVQERRNSRSVYKIDVECYSLDFSVEMAKWSSRSRSMTLIFYTTESIPRCILGAYFVILAQIIQVIVWTSQIYWNFEPKSPKWPWRSWSMTPIFNTRWEYPRMHVWCKFGDTSPNLWWVIMRTSQIYYNSETKGPNRPWRSRSVTFFFDTSRSMFGSNLVIPAQICEELSCGEDKVCGWTDKWMDAGNDNTLSAWKAKS